MKSIIVMATMLEAESAVEKYAYEFLDCDPFMIYKNPNGKLLVISQMGLKYAESCAEFLCKNFQFSEMINVGACGALSKKVVIGDVIYPKSYVLETCTTRPKLEPIILSHTRTVRQDTERIMYSKFADIVDMEAYALKSVCDKYNKHFTAIKYVSDFSENCDINKNIRQMRHCLNDKKEIWL